MRLHATLPKAVGVVIVAQLAKLGVNTVASVDKGLGAVHKRVIHTMTVETATFLSRKTWRLSSGLIKAVHIEMSGVSKHSDIWNTSSQSVELAGHSAADDQNESGERSDGTKFITIGLPDYPDEHLKAAAHPIGLVCVCFHTSAMKDLRGVEE